MASAPATTAISTITETVALPKNLHNADLNGLSYPSHTQNPMQPSQGSFAGIWNHSEKRENRTAIT